MFKVTVSAELHTDRGLYSAGNHTTLAAAKAAVDALEMRIHNEFGEVYFSEIEYPDSTRLRRDPGKDWQ